MLRLKFEHLKNWWIMATKEHTKTFDAVKMMRDIRDKVSSETQNMTLQQLKKYIADRLKNSPLKTIGK